MTFYALKNTKTSLVLLNEKNLEIVINKIKENLDESLLTGYCYYASAVLQKVFPELEIWRGQDDLGEYHWFNKNGEKVIDITEDQYYSKGRVPPYDNAEKKRQLGGRHGKKANRLLEKINR